MADGLTVVDFTVANNADWHADIALTTQGAPLNLGGVTIRMDLRSQDRPDIAVLRLETPSDEMSILGSTVRLRIDAGVMRGLAAGSYVYDMLLIDPLGTRRPMAGTVTVEQGVTR